jgi:16S rRNA (uracil1498-N3)-methyltransferase
MIPRLYINAPFCAGQPIAVSLEQSHYLRHVLRLENGAEVMVFNGHDGAWRGTLLVHKRSCEIRLDIQVNEQPAASPSPVRLIVAPCKRQDMVIEKATELGATQISPVLTQRTTVRASTADKWQRWAIEAAEQCERLDIPQIDPLQPLPEVITAASSPIYWAAERQEAPPLWSQLRADQEKPLTLLIGPEGGFSPAEVDLLSGHPLVIPVSLGPRILRTETAVIVALTSVMMYIQ